MMKAMLLMGKSYGFVVRNLCFCGAAWMPLFQFAEDGALAAGLDVVQPLAVVTYAAARARLHEF